MRKYMILTCKDFDQFIVDYLDKTLPWWLRWQFALHLAICPLCQDYMKRYLAAKDLGTSLFTDQDAAVPTEVPEKLIDSILKLKK